PPVEIVPVVDQETTPAAQQQTDASFGVDFPGLIESPILSEDPVLDDPVASGGDSSLYVQGGETEDEDSSDEEISDED
ncbi:MAG: hypothetical protein AAFR88_04400, partial [Pseudomonadota bacterium]